jgi:3-deoxy-D-manno-octulosonic-acid transferase
LKIIDVIQCVFVMHLIYSAALAVALFIGLPFWLVQMLRHGKYRAGVSERFGRVPARLKLVQTEGSIWVHAVSVGEVIAAAGLVNELRRRFPERRIYISTTTAAGQKLARARFGEDSVFYFPLDFAFAIRPYLKVLRPALVVLAETEFWPNFLRLADASGAQIAVVNARISDRSLPRYLRFRTLLRRALVPVDVFLAQSEEDKRRLVAIGARPERVQVSGNLKFDVTHGAAPAIVGQLRTAMIAGGAGPVIVAGSTVEGEETAVIETFCRVLETQSNSVLILAPRHPERFAPVAELVASSGMKFWRRSEWTVDQPVCGGVFLLDTIGELGAIYSLADIAFVGGSLAPRGGHNILEPAMYGVPVLVGPHTENFRDIIELFRRAEAVTIVQDMSELGDALGDLLADPRKRRELGDHAAYLVKQQSGATARTLDALESLLHLSKEEREVRPA